MSEQQSSHPVLQQFEAMKVQIKALTIADLEGLSEQTNAELLAQINTLKSDIDKYRQPNAQPKLNEQALLNAVESVANTEVEARYLMEMLGFGSIDPSSESSDFKKRDENEIINAKDFAPVTDPADAPTVPSGIPDESSADNSEETDEEPTDLEKVNEAKKKIESGIAEIAEGYDEFFRETKAGTSPESRDFPNVKSQMQSALAVLLDTPNSNGDIAMTETDLINYIQKVGGNEDKKEAFLLVSAMSYLGLKKSKDATAVTLTQEYIGDGDDTLDAKEFNRTTRRSILEKYNKHENSEKVDRNKPSTKLQSLLGAFPEFLQLNGSGEAYSSDQVREELRDIVDHMLANKEQYESSSVVKGGKNVFDKTKELGRDMAAGSAAESGDAIMGAMEKAVWTSNPETLNLSDPEKLANLIGMNLKEIVKDPEAAFKAIDSLVQEFENADTETRMDGVVRLKKGVDRRSVTLENLLKKEPLKKSEGSEADGPTGYQLNPDILKYVDVEVAKHLNKMADTISTPHRGAPFGNEYMEYLATTTINGGYVKPFHEWLNEDSNIPPLQKLFYNLKGFLQTLVGGIGGKIGLDKIPMIGNIIGETNDYDENNPHKRGNFNELIEKAEEASKKLDAWMNEDPKTQKDYLDFSSLVGVNIKEFPIAKQDPDGTWSNKEEIFQSGLTVEGFKAINDTESPLPDKKFTLVQFLTEIHKTEIKDATPAVIKERSIDEWKKFAVLKDEDGNAFFDDLSEITLEDYTNAENLSKKVLDETLLSKFPEKFHDMLENVNPENQELLVGWMDEKAENGQPYLDFHEDGRPFYNLDYGHPAWKGRTYVEVDSTWLTDGGIKTHEELIKTNKAGGDVLNGLIGEDKSFNGEISDILNNEYADWQIGGVGTGREKLSKIGYIASHLKFDEGDFDKSNLLKVLKNRSFHSLLQLSGPKFWKDYKLVPTDIEAFVKHTDKFDNNDINSFHDVGEDGRYIAVGGGVGNGKVECFQVDGTSSWGVWSDSEFDSVEAFFDWLKKK